MMAVLSLSLMGPTTGCAKRLAEGGAYTTGQAGGNPESATDARVLYNADKAIVSSYRILDSFLKWEQTYRSTVPLAVTQAADSIRANAERWIDSAINLRQAYAQNPTGQNRTALEKAITVLEQALAEASKYLAEAEARRAQPTTR